MLMAGAQPAGTTEPGLFWVDQMFPTFLEPALGAPLGLNFMVQATDLKASKPQKF